MRRAIAMLAGMPLWFGGILLGSALWAGAAWADQMTVHVTLVTPAGIGPTIGTIHLVDTKQGLRFNPLLKSLGPGPHGLRIYENGDCGPGKIGTKKIAGGAAGDPLDADKSGRPKESEGKGRFGNLPALVVDKDGIARAPLIAPDIKLAQIKGRAIVIHAGGDHDLPARADSSGGDRIACGVIR